MVGGRKDEEATPAFFLTGEMGVVSGESSSPRTSASVSGIRSSEIPKPLERISSGIGVVDATTVAVVATADEVVATGAVQEEEVVAAATSAEEEEEDEEDEEEEEEDVVAAVPAITGSVISGDSAAGVSSSKSSESKASCVRSSPWGLRSLSVSLSGLSGITTAPVTSCGGERGAKQLTIEPGRQL